MVGGGEKPRLREPEGVVEDFTSTGERHYRAGWKPGCCERGGVLGHGEPDDGEEGESEPHGCGVALVITVV